MTIPKPSERPVDPQGDFSPPWRRWFAQLDRRVGAIESAGTAETPAAPAANSITSNNGTLQVTPGDGATDVGLRILGDSGIGAALVKITRDIYGRITGTQAAATSDLSDVDLAGLADTNVLKWDAATSKFKPAAAGGVSDGDKGDVVVSSSGAAWTIDADAVGNTKLANMAAGKIKARKTASTGDPEDCSLSEVIDANLSSPADGDMIIRSAGAWTRLPKSLDGRVMRLVSGLPAWASAAASGGFAFVGEASVTGSAATSITLSGLDLASDQCYFILFAFDNATASSSNLSLQFNGDATATNYYSQFLTGDGTASNAVRQNSPLFCSLSASETNTGYFFMRPDLDGRPRTLSINNREAPASMRIQFVNHVWVTAANVTSLTVTSSVANALAVGSTVRIFKVSG